MSKSRTRNSSSRRRRLSLESLERRNLLAFGGLRAFLASGVDVERFEAADATPAIVAASVVASTRSPVATVASTSISSFGGPDSTLESVRANATLESVDTTWGSADGLEVVSSDEPLAQIQTEREVTETPRPLPQSTSLVATKQISLRTLLFSSANANTRYALTVGGQSLGTFVTDSEGNALLELQQLDAASTVSTNNTSAELSESGRELASDVASLTNHSMTDASVDSELDTTVEAGDSSNTSTPSNDSSTEQSSFEFDNSTAGSSSESEVSHTEVGDGESGNMRSIDRVDDTAEISGHENGTVGYDSFNDGNDSQRSTDDIDSIDSGSSSDTHAEDANHEFGDKELNHQQAIADVNHMTRSVDQDGHEVVDSDSSHVDDHVLSSAGTVDVPPAVPDDHSSSEDGSAPVVDAENDGRTDGVDRHDDARDDHHQIAGESDIGRDHISEFSSEFCSDDLGLGLHDVNDSSNRVDDTIGQVNNSIPDSLSDDDVTGGLDLDHGLDIDNGTNDVSGGVDGDSDLDGFGIHVSNDDSIFGDEGMFGNRDSDWRNDAGIDRGSDGGSDND